MKTSVKLIIVIFSILNINIACSQVSPLTHIKASELSILNIANKQIPYMGTKEELVLNFGQPILNNVLTHTDMAEYELEIYVYHGIEFVTEKRPENEIIFSFEITGSDYYIKYNNTTIKINDKIDDFENVFTKSFDYMVNNEKKSWLRIEFNPLDIKFPPYSSQLILNWDANTRQINSIEILSF